VGEFTKAGADGAVECAKAILDAMPRGKKIAFAGEFNELFLFLEAAKRAAPSEKPKGGAK
jgi:hypothetical protein